MTFSVWSLARSPRGSVWVLSGFSRLPPTYQKTRGSGQSETIGVSQSAYLCVLSSTRVLVARETSSVSARVHVHIQSSLLAKHGQNARM